MVERQLMVRRGTFMSSVPMERRFEELQLRGAFVMCKSERQKREQFRKQKCFVNFGRYT